ncbi:MAG: hypothetical protein IPK50_09395 [Fibrobacterota bacterium]|nr:MAG: hypothetical protein IPK50_09395 [Fibrobacterota bacterium]
MKLFSKSINRLWMLCAVVLGLCGAAQAWNMENFESYAKPDGEVIPNGTTLGAFKYYASNGKGSYFEASGQYSSKGLFRNWDAEHGGSNSTDFSFIRADRSHFNLASILVWDAGGESPTVILKGFRNGISAERAVINPFHATFGPTFTLNWVNIDSLVISDSVDDFGSGADLCTFVDNIVWEPNILPTATTGTKTDVGTSSATVYGTVNANNTNTTDSVQYGTTTAYGSAVMASPGMTAGSSPTSISAALMGLLPNTTYHYRVKAKNASGPYYGADSTFTTLAIPPSATTNAATDVGSAEVVLNGLVNANGASTVATFEYGATTSYGSTVAAAQSPVTGHSASAVSIELNGLTPLTTYHYRLKAVNVAGESIGSDQTFTTSAIAPTVTTGTTSEVGSASATVSGLVNANNATTTDSVQYGLTTSYGTTVVASPATATGASVTPISATLTSLTPNTTYHYRVKAVNAAGTSHGPDSTFTTTLLPQSIAFGALTAQTYGTEFVRLTAAASSGLPVEYASANEAAVHISNDTAYLLAADTATITATQAGDGSYQAANSVSRILTITKKALTIAGATAQGRDYDGTTDATVTGAHLDGVVNSDDVSLSLGTASFATKDTGTAKPVTVAGSSLTGTKAGNYSLTEVAGLTAKIQQATVSVTAFASTKAYGDPDPLLTYMTGPLCAGDVFTGALGRASGESVGEYAIGAGTLSAGANYLIDLTSAKLTITGKPLVIAGASAQNKIYDGTTEATVTGAHLDGVENSDDVGLSLGTASFATKDTGTAKIVTVTGSSLTGAKAGNYSLTEVTGLTANIGTKEVTINVDAKDKVYGQADPALTYMATPLCAGDAFTGSLSRASGEDVGEYAIGLGSVSAGGNYRFYLTGSKLTITKKTLTIAGATVQVRDYDGTTDATVTGAHLDGVVNSDDVSLSLGSASFATKDTGTAKPVTVTGSSLTGSKAGNYSLTEVSGLTASIAPKTITVNADAKDKVHGQADPVLTYMATPLCAGDAFTGALSRASGEDVGEYAIGQGNLSAGSNYDITFVGADLTISRVSALGPRPQKRPTSVELGVKVDRVFASMANGAASASLGGSNCSSDNSCQSLDVVLPAPSRISVAIFDNMGTPVIAFQERIDGSAFQRLQPTLDGRKVFSLAWNLRSAKGAAVQPGVFLWKIEVLTDDGRKLETVKRFGVK